MYTVGRLIEFLKNFPEDASVKVLRGEPYNSPTNLDLNPASDSETWYFNIVDNTLTLGDW